MVSSQLALQGYPVTAALRAYPETKKGSWHPKWPDEDWESKPFLIFDTETTTDYLQALLLGTYAIARLSDGLVEVQEEGVFYRDTLPEDDPDGYRTILQWAKRHGFRALSRREFVKRVFFPVAYDARGTVVGFNLPFDLSRLAVDAHNARKAGRGGFSLSLSRYQRPDGAWAEDKYLPRLLIKHIDSTRAWISFSKPRDPHPTNLIPPGETDPDPHYAWRGHFVDLRTLSFALSDQKHSLASALETFGVGERKAEVETHGVITPEYLDYAMQDVVATTALLDALLRELRESPLHLPPHRVYSPASFGKGFLRAAGLKAPLRKFPTDTDILGMTQTAYFGGRSEARIRRSIVPVIYVDFLSMYPTVNALLGTWPTLTAEQVHWVDATEEVRSLLEGADAESCLDPGLWSRLQFFAEISPHGDILPLRARYDGRSLGIGVNHVVSDRPLIYAGPDLVASKIITGQTAEVLRAWRPIASGEQKGLRPVSLAPGVEIDPTEDDLFKRLIEIRKSLGMRGLDPVEKARLSQFLKTVANSGGYGVFAQSNVKEYAKPRDFAVHGLDTIQAHLNKVEEPGPLSYPPFAALTTAGARLMLALLEHAVTERGGGYAFCDTDSMAIVADVAGNGEETALGVRVLSSQEVQEIVAKIDRLNPYDRERIGARSLLEIEPENYEDGRLRQLYVYAISAKRYALLTLNEQGRFIVLKASEHGLGHLLNPLDAESEDRDWIRQAYQWRIDVETGLAACEPEWLDRPALGRISVSSPRLMRAFAALNEGKPYDQQIKPFNFLLTATVSPLGHPVWADPDEFRLVAPFSTELSKWRGFRWVDLYTGREVPVTTAHPAPPEYAQISTMRDVLEKHFAHPEVKSADGAGRACGPATRGLLQRRRLHVLGVEYVGKESDRWEEVEQGLISDPADAVQCFHDESDEPWRNVIVPAMHDFTAAGLAQVAGISTRQLKKLRNGHASPTARVRQLLTAWILGRLAVPMA